jgi:hypothetical protein
MALHHFHAYFCLGCSGLRQSKFIAFRLNQLNYKLKKQQATILQRTLQSASLAAWKQPAEKIEALEELLTILYSRWVEILTGRSGVKEQAWQNLLKHLPQIKGANNAIIILDTFIDASRLLLTDVELLWCWEYRQVIYQSLEMNQACLHLTPSLAKQVCDQWYEEDKLESKAPETSSHLQTIQEKITQATPLVSKKLPIVENTKLEEGLVQLFSSCSANKKIGQLSLVTQLEFLKQFIDLVVVPVPLSSPQYKRLLFKLDEIFSQQLSHGGGHVFSNVIEVLIANVDRFDFIRRFCLQGLPCYGELVIPVGELLVIMLLLEAHEQSQLTIQFVRAWDGLSLWQNLSPSLKKLGNAHRQVIVQLRASCQLGELEWLIHVIERFNALLSHLQQTAYLLKHLKPWCQKKAMELAVTSSTDNHSKPVLLLNEQRILPNLIFEIIRLACLTVALTDNLSLRQELFRRAITLYLGPDREEPRWEYYPQIQSVLQQLDSKTATLSVHYQKLVQLIQPLLANFGEIIKENLHFPANWFGTATALQTVASPQLGCQYLDLVITLRQLAKYRRLYTQPTAVLELKYWYTTTILTPHLTDRSTLTPMAIYAAFAGAYKIFQSRTHLSPPQALLEVLTVFINQLPEITASQQLPSLISTISHEAIKQAQVTIAVLNAQELSTLKQHNLFLLRQAANLLNSHIDNPKTALVWWWHHFQSQFSNISAPLLEANLIELHRVLPNRLTKAEAKAIGELIDEVYHCALRINFSHRQTPTLKFFSFHLEGPGWEHWFSEPVATSYEQQGLIESTSALIAIEKKVLAQLADHNIARQIEKFIEIFLTHGELEATVQRIQPLFDDCLRTQPTRQLECAWQMILRALPQYMTPPQTAYWRVLLRQGILGIRQVGLGRRIQMHAAQLANELTQYLNHQVTPMNAEGQKKCERDLLFLLTQLSQLLRTQCPSLVALNMGRYLIECIVPFVTYSSHVWQMLWWQLEMLLLPRLDKSEQLASAFWINQLEAFSAQLPATHIMGQHLFKDKQEIKVPTNSPTDLDKDSLIFQELDTNTSHLENEPWLKQQAWRDVLSGLLTATLTPNDAPIPKRALIQRLWLSSPVLYNQITVVTWPTLESTWSKKLTPWIEDSFKELLAESYSELMSILLTHVRLEEMQHNMPRIGIFCTLLSHLPYATSVWQNLLLVRANHGGNISPTPCDSLVCQTLECECLNYTTFKAANQLLQQANELSSKKLTTIRCPRQYHNWNPLITWFYQQCYFSTHSFETREIHQEELKLWLQTLAMHTAWASNASLLPSPIEVLSPIDQHRLQQRMRQELFELLYLNLDEYNSLQQNAMIKTLNDAVVEYNGNQKELTGLALHSRECVDKLFMLTLASKLLTHYQQWAQEIVLYFFEQSQKPWFMPNSINQSFANQPNSKSNYLGNIESVLYRLGLTMAGLRTTELARWYQQRFGQQPTQLAIMRLSWLPLFNTQPANFHDIWQIVPKILAPKLTLEESRYLKKAVLAMTQPITKQRF